ncbi:hypothetical protein PTKIN_Ptkin18bG0017500 [Pterospermum kingtungense]
MHLQIALTSNGIGDNKTKVENADVVEMIRKLFRGVQRVNTFRPYSFAIRNKPQVNELKGLDTELNFPSVPTGNTTTACWCNSQVVDGTFIKEPRSGAVVVVDNKKVPIGTLEWIKSCLLRLQRIDLRMLLFVKLLVLLAVIGCVLIEGTYNIVNKEVIYAFGLEGVLINVVRCPYVDLIFG